YATHHFIVAHGYTHLIIQHKSDATKHFLFFNIAHAGKGFPDSFSKFLTVGHLLDLMDKIGQFSKALPTFQMNYPGKMIIRSYRPVNGRLIKGEVYPAR